MYRPYSCILMVLLLNGCATVSSDHFFKASPDISEQSDSYQLEKQALFNQPYIDPLTDYLIENQGDPARTTVLQQVRQERDQRCVEIAREYADEPATESVLESYNLGYGYSCPQQVADFEKRVKRQAVKPEPLPNPTPVPEPEPALEPRTAAPEVDSVSEKQASDQALSDCYLLTTIRNFSAAREACLEPAESGDARSQANMALVAYAFEDYPSALEWAKKAAAKSGDAAFLLAQMYETGRGVGQNTDQAVYWYSEAVRQGHEEAQAALDRHRNDVAPGDP